MEQQPEITAEKLCSRPLAAGIKSEASTAVTLEKKAAEPEAPITAEPPMEHWRRPWAFPYEMIGGLAVMVAGFGAATVPVPKYQPVAIGFGVLAVIVGMVGIVVAGKPGRGGRLVPISACAIGTGVISLAIIWPSLLALGPPLGDNVPRPFGRDVPAGGEMPVPSPDSMGPGVRDFRQGAIRVVIKSLSVDKVKFADNQTGDTTLQIALRVTNNSRDAALPYRGWSMPPRGEKSPAPALHDDHGKLLKQRMADSGKQVAGQVREVSVPAQGSVDDLLIFDAPGDTPLILRLDLPLSAIGGTGMVHIDFTGEAIKVH
jgi:hypothetical protein